MLGTSAILCYVQLQSPLVFTARSYGDSLPILEPWPGEPSIRLRSPTSHLKTGFATCQGSLLHGDLTKTFSPSSVSPWVSMARTCQLSLVIWFLLPIFFRFHCLSFICWSLPGPSVPSVFAATTAHDSHPPQGPLLMGGEGMLCFW